MHRLSLFLSLKLENNCPSTTKWEKERKKEKTFYLLTDDDDDHDEDRTTFCLFSESPPKGDNKHWHKLRTAFTIQQSHLLLFLALHQLPAKYQSYKCWLTSAATTVPTVVTITFSLYTRGEVQWVIDVLSIVDLSSTYSSVRISIPTYLNVAAAWIIIIKP